MRNVQAIYDGTMGTVIYQGEYMEQSQVLLEAISEERYAFLGCMNRAIPDISLWAKRKLPFISRVARNFRVNGEIRQMGYTAPWPKGTEVHSRSGQQRGHFCLLDRQGMNLFKQYTGLYFPGQRYYRILCNLIIIWKPQRLFSSVTTVK